MKSKNENIMVKKKKSNVFCPISVLLIKAQKIVTVNYHDVKWKIKTKKKPEI